jgi:hypothetical protein
VGYPQPWIERQLEVERGRRHAALHQQGESSRVTSFPLPSPPCVWSLTCLFCSFIGRELYCSSTGPDRAVPYRVRYERPWHFGTDPGWLLRVHVRLCLALGTDLGSEFQLLFPSTPLLFQSIDLKLNSSLLLIAQALGFKAVDGHSGRNHGVSITPMTINPSNQTRSDSKAGYIDPLPPRSNLFVPPSTLPVNLLLLYR